MSPHRPVRLGLMPPLTGIVGIYGHDITCAGKIACQEINESGGVLGKPLELIIEDDGSLPESSVLAAEKLLDKHGCAALVGNLMTNSRISVTYRVAEPRRVPYLCFSLYEGSVLSRYYFHFAALPNQQIDLMIPYMRKRYGPKMFFCGNNYEWPRGSIDAAKRILEKVNGETVGEEYLPIGIDKKDAQELMHKILYSGANVLVPFFAGSDELIVLNQFEESGLKNKMQAVMSHYDEVMASHLSPKVRKGLYSINSYFMSVDTPENRSVLKKLSLLPGIRGLWPHGNGILTNFGEGTYLCIKAYAKAVNQAHSFDAEAVINTLENISLIGPQGSVTIDRATHHAKVNCYLARGLANGTFEVIEHFGVIAPSIPPRYRHMQMSPSSSVEDLRVQGRIVEQMTDSVCLIDASNDTLLYVNPGFEHMFGYTKEEILGKPFSSLHASTRNAPQATPAEINKTLYQHGVWEGEIQYIKKNNTPLWCSAVISAFTHAYFGEVWIGILRDITEHKQIELELISAKEAAENAMRVKSRFLDIAAHELRTPVTGFSILLQFAQMQLEQKGKPVDLSTLNMLRQQAARLSRLVSDLLDVSYLERGTLKLKKTTVDLVSIASEYLNTLYLQVPKRQFTFSRPEYPVELCLDRDRILQVISNLLDNAVKYTPENTRIEVTIEDSSDLVRMSVIDHGPGIEERQQAALFNPFERGLGNQEELVSGLGLGLFICRRIIELHDGKIGIKSKKGCGSIFFFELPKNIKLKKAA